MTTISGTITYTPTTRTVDLTATDGGEVTVHTGESDRYELGTVHQVLQNARDLVSYLCGVEVYYWTVDAREDMIVLEVADPARVAAGDGAGDTDPDAWATEDPSYWATGADD